MASSNTHNESHIEIYSDVDSQYSDCQTHDDKPTWTCEPGDPGNTEHYYEVPLPARAPPPQVFVTGPALGPSRYVSQVYISSGISHRSKRHIRDSREFENIPQTTRNLLEVNTSLYYHLTNVCCEGLLVSLL